MNYNCLYISMIDLGFDKPTNIGGRTTHIINIIDPLYRELQPYKRIIKDLQGCIAPTNFLPKFKNKEHSV